MKSCQKCGYETNDGSLYCVKCGAPLQEKGEAEQQPAPEPAPYQVPPQYMPPASNDQESPISLGKWILYHLLPYAGVVLPVVGNILYIVLLFVWAFNGTEEARNNTTFRNWAKAQLIFQGIGLVLGVLLIVFLVALFLSGATFFSQELGTTDFYY